MRRLVVLLLSASVLATGCGERSAESPATTPRWALDGAATAQLDADALACAERFVVAEEDAAWEAARDALIDLAVDHETQPFDGAVAFLLNALDAEDEVVRYNAALALGILDRRALAAVERLAALSRDDPDAEVRAIAVHALGQVAPPPRAFAVAAFGEESLKHMKPVPPERDPALARRMERLGLEAVVAALDDDVFEVRKEALGEIDQWGAEARPHAKKVAAFLTDLDRSIRYTALLTVRYIDAPAELVVRRVARLLTDPSPYTRRAAALLLRDHGPAASAAVPALEEAARDPEVREAAEQALDAIWGEVEEKPLEAAAPVPPPGAG